MFPWYKGSNASRAKQSPSCNHVTKSTVLGHSNLHGICPVNQKPIKGSDRSYGGLLECPIGLWGSYFGLAVARTRSGCADSVREPSLISLDVRIGSRLCENAIEPRKH